ncbi:MAG: alanine--glyoxylate aminotransferase family protein [Lachnospiraceae bacterium]|nr:alanine--glyoxylate aminotransferase family protein [Lachnospiraceae bacterium]
MKLFTVGPVEMFPETLEISGRQLPYFRTPEFSEIMLENERLLKESVGAPTEAKTVFLTASGTGAMEAAVINCFTEADKLLIINGGSFGQRFSDICRIHRIPYDEIKLPFGDTLTAKRMAEADGQGYSALLVNLHETSAGQLYDIAMLSEFCQRNHMYLIVDAISAYGADEIDFEKYNVDVLILSSQKALALSPGISMAVISARMYEERVLKTDSGSLYLDFKEHIANMTRGQTPFTPAVGILLELHHRLKQIQSQGILQMNKEMQSLAERFREQLQQKGFTIPAYPLSNALTPVLLKPHAREMYEALKEEYGLIVTPNGGSLADTVIRIGHLGNVKWQDYEELLAAMVQIRERL